MKHIITLVIAIILASCAHVSTQPELPVPDVSVKETDTHAGWYGRHCPKLTSEKQQACTQQGGSMQRAGMMGCYRCIITYSDAGKSCRGSDDCEGKCYATKHVIPNTPNQVGQCAKTNNPFGCKQEIQANGVAKYGALCVD